MATFLASKAPTETVERRWTVPLDDGDGILSVMLSASGVTIETNGNSSTEVVLVLSGGTASATGSIVATVTTSRGRVLVETLYIPIVASASQVADTARDYCNFALRKIIGNGNDPDADELADALERFNGMIAKWRAGGADLGAPYPIEANSVIYCPDWAVDAIRYNLRVACHDHYDAPITAFDVEQAKRGLQLVKHKSLRRDEDAGIAYAPATTIFLDGGGA